MIRHCERARVKASGRPNQVRLQLGDLKFRPADQKSLSFNDKIWDKQIKTQSTYMSTSKTNRTGGIMHKQIIQAASSCTPRFHQASSTNERGHHLLRTKTFQKHRNVTGNGALWPTSDNLLCDGGGTAEREEEAGRSKRGMAAGLRRTLRNLMKPLWMGKLLQVLGRAGRPRKSCLSVTPSTSRSAPSDELPQASLSQGHLTVMQWRKQARPVLRRSSECQWKWRRGWRGTHLSIYKALYISNAKDAWQTLHRQPQSQLIGNLPNRQ